MFNKNKKPNEFPPTNQPPKDKSGVVVNKGASSKLDDNKDSNQAKSDMQSEGGCS